MFKVVKGKYHLYLYVLTYFLLLQTQIFQETYYPSYLDCSTRGVSTFIFFMVTVDSYSVMQIQEERIQSAKIRVAEPKTKTAEV